MVHEEKNLFLLENLYNVRDLGDLSTMDGKKTKKYKYIRGSAKGSISDEEKSHFYNIGTRVVVDLRYTEEIEKKPSPLRDYQDMKYYHVDMMGEFFQMREKGYKDLSDLYIDLLTTSQEKIKKVLQIFAAHKDEGIYFHCTAGKDRTGIIAMFLLELIGVDRATIISNYAESFEHNKHRPGYKNLPEEFRKFVLSEPEYMVRALKYIDDNFGTSANYLLSIGLTSEEIEILQTSFIQ